MNWYSWVWITHVIKYAFIIFPVKQTIKKNKRCHKSFCCHLLMRSIFKIFSTISLLSLLISPVESCKHLFHFIHGPNYWIRYTNKCNVLQFIFYGKRNKRAARLLSHPQSSLIEEARFVDCFSKGWGKRWQNDDG